MELINYMGSMVNFVLIGGFLFVVLPVLYVLFAKTYGFLKIMFNTRFEINQD